MSRGLQRRGVLAGATALAAMAALPAEAQFGGPSSTRPSFAGRPIDLFEYGNSFTARGFNTSTSGSVAYAATSINGLAPMLEAMSGGSLRIKNPTTMMAGNNGKSSTFLAQNFAVQVAPSFALFDWLVMWGWAVNDFLNGISAAQSLANIQSIHAACRSAGKVLLLGTPYYTRSGSWAPTAAQALVMAQANRMVAAWARKTPGVIYFDFWNDIADPAQPFATSYRNLQDSDNLHPATLGVQIVARRCLSVVAPILRVNAQLGAFNTASNPGDNLFTTYVAGGADFAGSATVSAAGCSGTLPTGWSVGRTSGTDTIVCGKVVVASGYGSHGTDLLTVGVSNAAAACSAVIAADLACPASLVGKQVEAQVDLFVPETPTGFADVTLNLNPNYGHGSLWGLRVDALPATYWIGGQKLRMRTPPYTMPSGTTRLYLQVNMSFLAGANGAFQFARPVLRQVG